MLGLLGLLLAMLSVVPPVGATGERASGQLVDGTGKAIGSVTLEQEAGAVRLTIALNDDSVVKQGNHGVHFHAIGSCAGLDFATAGGHFNPTGKQHGAKNPQGTHAGDLPNLPVDASTRNRANAGYSWVATTTVITLGSGPTSLFDADGTALVIHAGADDELTDPSGNSGGRIACAVLTPIAPGLPSTGAGGGTAAPTTRTLLAVSGVLTLVALAVTLRLRRRHA
jgi:superoxide dismutase, Cu-Zn family